MYCKPVICDMHPHCKLASKKKKLLKKEEEEEEDEDDEDEEEEGFYMLRPVNKTDPRSATMAAVTIDNFDLVLGLMHHVPLGISGLPGWLKTPPQFCPGTMLLDVVCCISCCRARGILTQDASSCHTWSSARVTNWLGPSLQTQHSSELVQA